MYEEKVLRRIFGPKRNEMAGGCRKLHIEAHYNLHASQNIMMVIKSRRVRWAGRVARMRENKCVQ
jgi:hypothetical protein